MLRRKIQRDPDQALCQQELLELQEHNASIQESTEHQINHTNMLAMVLSSNRIIGKREKKKKTRTIGKQMGREAQEVRKTSPDKQSNYIIYLTN